MDDRAAELLDALECRGQVGDGEVREGSGIARTGTTLVDPEAEAVGIRFPPGSGGGRPRCKLDAEDSAPEAAGATGVVGRKLDQWRGHRQEYGPPGPCFAAPVREQQKGQLVAVDRPLAHTVA